MTLRADRRCHPRIPVQWPVVFYSSDFFGHGMVIDVSAFAWRLRGGVTIPVGMHLGVRVWPQRWTYLEIEEAIVIWTRSQDFAIELHSVRPEDEAAMRQLQEQTIGVSPLSVLRSVRTLHEPIGVYPEGTPGFEHILCGRTR
jgi:hypothetical protein